MVRSYYYQARPYAAGLEAETLAHLQLADALGYTGVDVFFVDQVVKVLKRHHAWDTAWEYLYDPSFGVLPDPDRPGRIRGMLSLRGRHVAAVPGQPGLLYTPATATAYAQVDISGGVMQITGIAWPELPRFTMVGVDRVTSPQDTVLWGFYVGDVIISSMLQYGYRRWNYSTNYSGNNLTFNDGTNYRGQWLGTVAWFDFDQPVQLQCHSRDGLYGTEQLWGDAPRVNYLAYDNFTLYLGSNGPVPNQGAALLRLQGLRAGQDRALMEDLRELGYAERTRRCPVVEPGAVVHFRDEEVDFFDYELAAELAMGTRWGYNADYQGSYTGGVGQLAVPRAVVRSPGTARVELEFLKNPAYAFAPTTPPTRVYLNGQLEAELMSYGPAGWVSWRSRVLPPGDYRVRLVTGHVTVLKQLRVVPAVEELAGWTGPVAPAFVEEDDFHYGLNPMPDVENDPRHHGNAARVQHEGARYDATGYAPSAVQVWSATDPGFSQQLWVEVDYSLVGSFSQHTALSLDSRPLFTRRVRPGVQTVAVSNLTAEPCRADAIEFVAQPLPDAHVALPHNSPRLVGNGNGNFTYYNNGRVTNRFRDALQLTYAHYAAYTYHGDAPPLAPLLQLYRDGRPWGPPRTPTPGQRLFEDTCEPGCQHTLRIEVLSPSDQLFWRVFDGDFVVE